jgi:uncharacterized protein YdcH (DUF465 family)
MMIDDKNLIEILIREDPELAEYVARHRALEARVEELAARRSLSSQEQVELTRLKKEKLAGRDKIAKILDDYRRNRRAVIDSVVKS